MKIIAINGYIKRRNEGMRKMGKIVLVNAVYFNAFDNFHIGQFILRDILKKEYDVSCINFDYLLKLPT